MILEEFLETSNAGFFYIGAMGGSGFFAMGSKEDIKDEIRYQERMEELAEEKRMSKANVDSREVQCEQVYECLYESRTIQK